MRQRPSGLIIVGSVAAAVLVCGLIYVAVSALVSDDDPTTESSLVALTTTTTSTTLPVTTTTQPLYYEVQQGDTLFSIAEQFKVRMEDIIALNEISNPDDIPAGVTLKMPPPTVLLNSTTAAG